MFGERIVRRAAGEAPDSLRTPPLPVTREEERRSASFRAPYSTTERAVCSLDTGGAITMAAAKTRADSAKNAAAATTGQNRSRGRGGASSARASASAAISRAEEPLAMA